MALAHSLDGIRPNKLENLQCPNAHPLRSKDPNISLGHPPKADREDQYVRRSEVKLGRGRRSDGPIRLQGTTFACSITRGGGSLSTRYSALWCCEIVLWQRRTCTDDAEAVEADNHGCMGYVH